MKEIVQRAEVEVVGAVWPGQALAKVAAFEKLFLRRETESVLCRTDWGSTPPTCRYLSHT